MRSRIIVLVCVTALAGACARRPTERTVIDDAAAALGGKDRILATKTIVISGEGLAPQLGQSQMPDSALPIWKVTEFKRTIDLVHGRTRMQQRREAQFEFAGATVQRLDQSLDGDVAFNGQADDAAARAGAAAARDRRIEMLHHPIVLVRAALDPAAKLTNLRQQGSQQVVDVTTADGETLSLSVDGPTKLPSRITSMVDQANLGDAALVTSFTGYETVSGLKLPRRLTTSLDRYVQFDLVVSTNTVDGEVGDLAAPAAVRSAIAPPPPPVVVTAEPVGKGVWWLAGSGNHRSVVFEFADHLVLFEAPVNEARSKAVIDKARTLSTKPLTHVIISHHHFDHSGGLRVAVAEGLTIITYRGNEAFFRELLARKHSIAPDELQKNPKPPIFQLVDDQLTLKDDSMEVRLYHLIDNPREGTNLFAYVPSGRILVQADLYDSTWQQHLWGENVLSNFSQRNLQIDKDVPIHGAMEPFAQMVKTIKAKPTVPVTN